MSRALDVAIGSQTCRPSYSLGAIQAPRYERAMSVRRRASAATFCATVWARFSCSACVISSMDKGLAMLCVAWIQDAHASTKDGGATRYPTRSPGANDFDRLPT